MNMNDVKIIIFHNEVYLSEQSKNYFEQKINPLNPRIKSHLLFAGIISAPFSPR